MFTAGTHHAPFPFTPTPQNYTASVVEAAFAADSQVSSASGYDGTLAVSGSNLVNGSGNTIQLRGTNIQGQFNQMFEGVAFLGSTGVHDISGGTSIQDQAGTTSGSGASTVIASAGPIISYMQPWKFNVVRIGLNEASLLGYTAYGLTGTATNPNNYGSYPNLSYIKQISYQIAALNAIGCYVDLVLAWTNPGRMLPVDQDIMANQDNTLQAWQVIAGAWGFPNGTELKMNGGTVDNRSVMFEMFNEPKTFESQIYNGGWLQFYYQYAGGNAVYPFPINTPTGTFTPGESFTASNGTTGKVLCYYLNTTTGYQSSGTKFLHCNSLAGTNITAGAPTIAAPMPPGTVITGSSSGATATITSTVYPGQAAAGQYGWYVAGNKQLIAAVRAAGAGNVCVCSGPNYAGNINNWLSYMAGADTTAPAGWNSSLYGTWTSQMGAHWHPYPAYSIPTALTIAAGGSGYAVNDTVLLEMDETGGPNSGRCYYQTQVKVTSVSAGAITGASFVTTYVGGTPGISGGGNGQFATTSSGGGNGAWTNVNLPATVPADTAGAQPGTSGTGASFNLTYTNEAAGSGKDLPDWPTVVNIKTTGYPVVITETGEHTGTGIVGSPYMAALTAWADTNGISLMSFAYTPNTGWYNAKGYDFGLTLTTLTGSPQYRTPSPGYGVFMFNWYSTHA